MGLTYFFFFLTLYCKQRLLHVREGTMSDDCARFQALLVKEGNWTDDEEKFVRTHASTCTPCGIGSTPAPRATHGHSEPRAR